MSGGFEAVLFDFDGVLMDSEPVHWAAWQDALAPLGVRIPWATWAEHVIGASEPATMEILSHLANPPLELERVRALYPVKKEMFGERMRANPPFAPGIRNFMAKLTAGYRLAVVSASSRTEIEPLLERGGLREFLGAVVCGEDVAHQKPAPDPYLLAASLLGIQRALVVEDSDTGLESARRAGFPAVRIPSPTRTVELVAQALDGIPAQTG